MTALNPSRRRRLALPALVAVAGLLMAACGSSSDDGDDKASDGFSINVDDCEDPAAATAKITDKIVVGYSAPLSGPVAGPVELATTGYDARIKMANDAGGINGVKIEVKYRDDAFQPDKTKANGTEFIQKDKVDALATFGSGGTGALADDQNAACIPLLYPSSSDPKFLDMELYPWTVQFLPSAAAETAYLVKYIQDNVDDPKVGVVENPTASGKAQGEAFQESAKAADMKILDTVEDTDPAAAATAMKAAGANVVYHGGVTGTCGVFDSASARVDYKPELVVKASNCANAAEYIAAGAGADGVVIAKYLKDPSDPDLAKDPAVVEYLKALGNAPDPSNTITVAGWVQADLLINTLQQAADSEDGLTHQSMIEAARDQDYASPMLIDGVKWVSSADRNAGVSGFAPYAWNAKEKRFINVGDVTSID